MKAELEIGKALRPRGLKGELKVEIFTNSSDWLERFHGELKIDGKTYPVRKFTREGAFGYLQLEGVDSVEKAEALRGKSIFASRECLPKLNEGEYYVEDVIGLDVIVDGKCVGRITDVLQYGAADVYTAKQNEKSFSFPALKKLILSIDLSRMEITLDKAIFDSVVVYN